MMSKEQVTVLGRRLGFVIDITITPGHPHPTLTYLDGAGLLSHVRREPTEAELRMWCLLVEEHYEPWSLSPQSATRNALIRNGLGFPVDHEIPRGNGA